MHNGQDLFPPPDEAPGSRENAFDIRIRSLEARDEVAKESQRGPEVKVAGSEKLDSAIQKKGLQSRSGIEQEMPDSRSQAVNAKRSGRVLAMHCERRAVKKSNEAECVVRRVSHTPEPLHVTPFCTDPRKNPLSLHPKRSNAMKSTAQHTESRRNRAKLLTSEATQCTRQAKTQHG